MLVPWNGRNAKKMKQAHAGACYIIYGDQKNLCYTGGKDGLLLAWSYADGQLIKTNEININMNNHTKFHPGIVAFDIKPNGMLVGTKGGEIYEFK